jgi:carboxylesterase
MSDSFIVPKSEPFFLPGGRTGCLLLHGFTSMPDEMRPLGDFLHEQGYTVLGARLAGHATHPLDLARTRWQDWMVNVEENLVVLRAMCDHVVLIGQSMGGMLALLAASHQAVAGAVAISIPDHLEDDWRMRTVRFWSLIIPLIFKGRTPMLDFSAYRRESDYPAYPYYPTRILGEVEDLKRAMRKRLEEVQAPVLLVQAHNDPAISQAKSEYLLHTLPSARKELFWLDAEEHSIVLDPLCCGPAFEKIAEFLKGIAPLS